MPSSYVILPLLLTVCFTLATFLNSRLGDGAGNDKKPTSVFAVLFGDARRMFANHFFTKSDVYFHSGYYPSIFDQAGKERDRSHLTGKDEHAEHDHAEHEEEEEHHCEHCSSGMSEHEREMDFLKKPRDWVDRFGRNFYITEHTHLESGREREILPWLKLSAELDPHQVETYIVASYWLRKHLGKVQEAEQFLREGQRANPDSFEILSELGRLYEENYHDLSRASNVFEIALKKWEKQNEGASEPDIWALRPILISLARIEEKRGEFDKAISHLEMLKQVSPAAEMLQLQIDELKSKAASQNL